MRKRIVLLVVMVMMSLSFPGIGQTVKALEVGDVMPDYTLVNLINHPTKTAKVSGFRGRLLILYFWNSHCGLCLTAFPKLEELQKQYAEKIQIVLINASERESVVRDVFTRRDELTGLKVSLPTVCGDSVISELLPYFGVPAVVWVGKDGAVKSKTFGASVNAENIKKMLEDEAHVMTQLGKVGMPASFEANKPLFMNGNGGEIDSLISYSLLTKGDPGLFSSISLIAAPSRGYFSACTNVSIYQMYRLAYSNIENEYGSLVCLPVDRVVLAMKDTSRYVPFVNKEYIRDNLYVYQLLSPPVTRRALQEQMQADLKRYFGLRADWEKRKVPCLVLRVTDTAAVAYRGGERMKRIDEFKFKLNKVKVQEVFVSLKEYLNAYYFSHLPLVDETGMRGALGGIDIETDVGDYRALSRALKKYTMSLTVEEREIAQLVLRDPE